MKKWSKRTFLNKRRGLAAVEASIELEQWKDKKNKDKMHHFLSADVVISDCNRQVTLDFSDRAKAVAKCDLLINTLLDFRDQLEATIKEIK